MLFHAHVTTDRTTLTAALLGALVLNGLAFAALPADAAFPGRNGRIAFTREIGTNSEVFTMNGGGSGQFRVTNSAGDERRPVFSPGGTRLAFARIIPPGNWDIFTANFDGREETNRTNDAAGQDYTPAFSPDGRRIAYSSFRGLHSDIYVMNVDGSRKRRLTATAAADEFYPAISPDGMRIAYQSNRDGDWEIFTATATGSRERQLTHNTAGDLHPVFSPDGKRIAFESNRGGDVEIYTMDLDGSRPVNRTRNPATDLRPAFSPDGRRIAFDSNRDGNREIYTMNVDGSGQRNRSNNPLSDDAVPDWGVSVRPPRVTVRGIPRRCASRGFRARIRISSADSRHQATVLLDKKRLRASRKATLRLGVRVRGLRPGSHRLKVIAVDAVGNSTRSAFLFRRCARR